MSRRPICALAVLLAALVACGKTSDDGGAGSGGHGDATGGHAATGGTNGRDDPGAGVGGAAAGRSAQGGAASGRGGAATSGGTATSGGAGTGSAGRASAGGTAGADERGGAPAGGRAGSATLGGSGGSGGRGGEVGSAGSSELAGAGGEPNEPSSSCADPFDTVDVSRLVANEAFTPYVVTGNSANQIRQSINQNRGMDYDAFTDWYVSWQFGDCSGHGLVVTVDVTYDFPEWQPPASTSADLIASWERYMDALFCHEYGHAKHALDCANDVFTALTTINAGGDCAEQQAEAEAAFNPILDQYNQLDVQYDADTNHGATMGAVFPPP